MTNQEHPIIPPPNLVEQWWDAVPGSFTYLADEMQLATAAAQWGANQELNACEQWVEANFGQIPTHNLHQFRRPKPPSEVDQALETLNWMKSEASYDKPMIEIIRRQLERLKELERPNDQAKQYMKDAPMTDFDKIFEKYNNRPPSLYKIIRDELGYSHDCTHEIVDAVEKWLPKEDPRPSYATMQWDKCVRMMREKLWEQTE